MRRWDDLFEMLKAAKEHHIRLGYGLKPYEDVTGHNIGFICEVMHEVFQINLVTASEQIEQFPGIKSIFLTQDGRQVLAKYLSGHIIIPRYWTMAFDELAHQMNS